MSEEWLEIPGFPNYEVSNQGRVRSVERDVKHGYEYRGTTHVGGILVSFLYKGRPRLGIYVGDGSDKEVGGTKWDIARLVLTTFVCEPPFGKLNSVAWNIDGDKENCHLDNLTWVHREFLLAMNMGRIPRKSLEEYASEYSIYADG